MRTHLCHINQRILTRESTMATRMLRWATYLILILLLLCVTLLLSLRLFPARFIPLVQSAVKDASGYELSVAGLAVEYAPLELRLQGVTVIDPAAGDKPLVELADGKVSVDLWRAIRGKQPYWSLHAGEGSLLLLPPTEEAEEEESPATEAASAINILAFLSFFGVSASDIKLLEVRDGKTLTTRIDADFERLDDNRIDTSFIYKSPTEEIAFKGVLEHALVDGRSKLKLSADSLDLSSLLTEHSAEKDAGEQAGLEQAAASEDERAMQARDDSKPETKPPEEPMSWAWLTQLGLLDFELTIGDLLLGADKITDLDVSLAFDPQQLWVKRINGKLITEFESHAIEQKLALSGYLKPLDTLTNGPDADLELKLDSEKIALALNGTVNLNGAVENDLTLDLHVEDLQKFQPVLPVESDKITPLTLQTTVQTGDDLYTVKGLKLRYAKSDLNGDIALHTTNELLKLEGKLTSKRLHIPKPAGEEDEAEPSGDAEVAAKEATQNESEADQQKPEFLLAKEPIDWNWLAIADVDFSLLADTLRIFDADFSAFEAQAEAEDGKLTIKPFAAKFGGGGFSGTLNLNKTDDGADLELGFKMDGVDLDAFGLTSKEQLEGGVTNLDIKLKGMGASVHELAASLDGNVLLTVKEATVKNDTFELIGSDLVMETLNKLNPFAKSDPSTELECALVKFDVLDGVFNSRNQLVVETTKMEITGNGKIDLNDESLSIGITPSTKGGVGVNVGSLVKFMKLGGTLANPKPAADAAGLLKSGAAIGAAASTGGLSIVAEGLAKQVLNAGNACDRALELTQTEKTE